MKRFLLALLLIALPARGARADGEVPAGPPLASIDLATDAGVRLVKGQWRYSDTRIVEIDFRSPGSDGQPSRVANRTYDFTPHAGGACSLLAARQGPHRGSSIQE